MEIARPIPSAWPRITAVVIPTTSPRLLTRGPPEFPGLIEASVWITSGIVMPSCWMSRPLALTTPLVTVGPPGRSRALPMARTSSPTWSASELPSSAAVSPSASIWSTARSVGASRPTMLAWNWRPSSRVMVILSAGWPVSTVMTWLLVTMWPSSSMMKPVPTPGGGVTCPNTSSVAASLRMCTTDGRNSFTKSGAFRTSSSPGMPSATAVGDGVAADGVPSEPPPQAARTAARTRSRSTDRLTRTARGTAILLCSSVTRLRCTSNVLPCRMVPHRRFPEDSTNLAWRT